MIDLETIQDYIDIDAELNEQERKWLRVNVTNLWIKFEQKFNKHYERSRYRQL